MTGKTLLGNLLRRAGYQLVRLRSLPTINFAWHLKHLLISQEVDTVFDVGANRGQFRDLLRGDANYTGRILSFEPVAHLHRGLQERASKDPDWHVYPFALGATAETIPINVMHSDDWSSFLPPTSEGTARFRGSNTVESTQMAVVRRLDDVFPALAKEHRVHRAYLKLDTQGFDLNAMRGGADVLREFVALQTEAVVIPLYSGMPTYEDVIRYAEKQGFAISGVFPISNDESLRLIEFDCVMVNTSKVNPTS